MVYSFQKFEFTFHYNNYTILSVSEFFALRDVLQVNTLRHINDDVAKCTRMDKTETKGAGVEKVKILTI